MSRSIHSSTSEDLEAELIELYDALDTKDARIRQLEEEIAAAKETGKSNKRSSNKDLKKCQQQLKEYKEAVTDLEAQLQEAQVDRKLLIQQMADLGEEVDAQKAELAGQQERIVSIQQQSEDAKKIQKDQSDSQYRLELENKQLCDTIKELEENEEDLVAEVELLANEKYEAEIKCRSIAEDKDQLRRDLDQRIKNQADNEDECIELHEQLELTLREHNEFQEETKTAQEAHEREISALRADLEKARKENKAIEERAALSYGAQKQQALQNEIDNLRQEVRRARDEIKSCNEDKDQAEQDLESTCKALVDAGKECEERIQNAIVQERMNAKDIETRLEAASLREKDLVAEIDDLLCKKNEIAASLARSEERNSWYEEGHGLADAVRYQKKLEAELYRRDHDLKQLRGRLDAEVVKSQVLQETCVLLKEKANLVDDPMFEEKAVKDAMQSRDNQLKSQNAEQNRQIEQLEADRLSMMKQLRHNAAEIGEKGIKFLGLDASETQKVLEFASNIRDGTVTLPLNDCSRDLKDELLDIKSQRETDKVTIERLEREIIGLRGCDADQVKAATEVQELKKSLNDAHDERKTLQKEVATLREDAAKALSAQQVSMEDVLPPAIRERAHEIIGESLVDMPSAAQVQLLCLVKEYNTVSEGLSQIQESIREADEKDGSTNASSVHMKILEQKMAIFNVSSDSPLYKDVKTMASQLADCSEQLAAREKDVLSKDELIRQYESEIKTMREQVSTLYKDHIEQQKQEAADAAATATATAADGGTKASPKKSCKESSADNDTANDTEQLQLLQKELKSVREVAQGRMAQLKALLDEKNATIERYRRKLARYARESASDTGNDSQMSDESETTVAKLRQAVKSSDLDSVSEAGSEARIGLVKQVDALASLVRDKEARIHRLETKLRESEEGRTTSEIRCNNALHEIDRIKGDMQSLSHLINHSEGRMVEATSATRQISMLQSQLDEKEHQLHRMSSQLAKLKARGGASNSNYHEAAADEAKISLLSAEVAKVKRQLTSTRLAKRKCEEELEQSKKQSSEAAADVARMDQEVSKLKQVVIDARMDKENASSKAVRAMTKLKEIQKAEDAKRLELERVQELEKKVASLLRKNSNLRGQLASAKQGDEGQADPTDSCKKRSETTDSSNKDQAKLRTLEKRLEERRSECKKLRDDLDSVRKTRQKERGVVSELQASLKALEDENTQLREDLVAVRKKARGDALKAMAVDADAAAKKQDEHYEKKLMKLQDEVADLKRNQVNQSQAAKFDTSVPTCKVSEDSSHHQRLKDVEKEKEQLADKLRTVSLEEQRLQSKIVNLESEKAMLQRELHSFDLEFFEEIEDLRFRAHQATQKLKEMNVSPSSSSEDDAPWTNLL